MRTYHPNIIILVFPDPFGPESTTIRFIVFSYLTIV